MSGHVVLSGVTRRFSGAAAPAVDDFSLEIAEGEAVVLLGPSGCGKTTCLRMIAGFERPDDGTITVDERVVAGNGRFVPPEKRHMSVMFQNYALWPHMTVFDNVAYGPRTAKLSRAEVTQRVVDALSMVGLEGFDTRYPHQLSGGQQQRVAMARALSMDPTIMLLDEPLSNLDSRLREEMRGQLKRMRRDLKITMVYVTHDQAEALSLADRIVVMRDGHIEQIGTPTEVYRRPRTRYVARALGSTNIIAAELKAVEGDALDITIFDRHPMRLTGQHVSSEVVVGDTIAVSVRPSDLVLRPASEGTAHVTVVESLFYGDSVQYEVRTSGGEVLTALGPGLQPFDTGDVVSISLDPDNVVALEE